MTCRGSTTVLLDCCLNTEHRAFVKLNTASFPEYHSKRLSWYQKRNLTFFRPARDGFQRTLSHTEVRSLLVWVPRFSLAVSTQYTSLPLSLSLLYPCNCLYCGVCTNLVSSVCSICDSHYISCSLFNFVPPNTCCSPNATYPYFLLRIKGVRRELAAVARYGDAPNYLQSGLCVSCAAVG